MSNKRKILISLWILLWSLPFTVSGAITALFLIITGHKPIKWGPAIRFIAGRSSWGGLELGGCFFVTWPNASYHVKCHETGHLLQQIMFGPFTWFIATIPSMLRYWLYIQKTQKSKYIYSILITLIILILISPMIIFGGIFSIYALLIIGIILSVYFLGLGVWMVAYETPKYAPGKPRRVYDDFWVEKDATNRGMKFIQKYYPELGKEENK